MVLEDEDVETFQRFNEWLYAKVLLQEHEKKDGSSHRILADLFIFAEKRIIPRLQNDTIDALIRLADATNECLAPSDIERIWLHTAESSKLRRFAVDEFVYTANLGYSFDKKNGGETFDADFVRQVAMGLWATIRDSEANDRADHRTYVDFKLWKHRCCRYHTHEDAESLCAGSLLRSSAGGISQYTHNQALVEK